MSSLHVHDFRCIMNSLGLNYIHNTVLLENVFWPFNNEFEKKLLGYDLFVSNWCFPDLVI